MKTQNTFADGINMDVNPLVAPKTVMSNCLNGTLITYNGNENVLQNDMGNGKVGSAYLPAGWVPVGMQEYGGIIYVAAYNPETKESQLGSFPSPLQNFENSNNADSISFLLKEGKYPLFNDKELQLKPGNKLAVELAPGLYEEVEKNFNNPNTSHKKRWSVRLCLLTSNGVLTDVTDNLSNLANPSKIDEEDEYNDFFFLENTAGSLEDYLRIYSGTLVGTPYIQVAENLASSMDVEVLPGYDADTLTVTFKVKCTITSSSLLKGYENENYGLKGIYWRASESWTGSGYNFSDDDLEITDISNVQSGQEYSVTVDGIIRIPNVPLTYDNNDIVLEIYPNFEWKDAVKYPQYSLMYRQAFDATKIGTGIHKINQWRYYYDEDFITLTWGMESYPSLGEEVKEVNMRFIGYDGNPINFGNTMLTFKRSTFNGEFTEVLDSKLFTYKFPYIAEITWQAGNQNFLECRWIIPTPLYNDFYQSKRILDFYHPEGQYVKDFNAVKVIEGNVLQFAEKPFEQVIDLGWEYFPIVSKNSLSDKTITYTKIYQYTPKARLKVVLSSDYYPFEVNYSNVRNIRINDSLASSISNYLITPHDIKYEKVSNINVSKLFECHNEDFLNNYTGYMIFGVTRFRHTSGDENRLTMYAYNNKGNIIIDTKLIVAETDDGTIRYNLNEFWSSTVRTYLDNLLNITLQFVIPVVFFAEDSTGISGTSVSNRALGLNYVIKKDGEWYLYWNKEIWTKISDFWWTAEDEYDKLKYFPLNTTFTTAPNTLYENRSNLPKPLPYLRCASTNGSTVSGWLVRNNSSNITQDSEEEFKFNVKADATIRIVTTIDGLTQNYSTMLSNFIDKYTELNSLTRLLRNELIGLLTFNTSPNVTVEQSYEYINTRVGTYELCEQLENYKNYGVSSLVLYNEEYISPKEELDADGVYLYENGNFIDVAEATTLNYKSFKYIVGSKPSVHSSVTLSATVDEDSIKINLIEIPTFNGSETFLLLSSDANTPGSSEEHPYRLETAYGTGYDVNRDGIIDYWVILLGYYNNGAKRMLRGIDTDEDGKPDKWEEINPPRNE